MSARRRGPKVRSEDDSQYLEAGRGLTLRTGARWLRLVDRRLLALGRSERLTIAAMAALGASVSAMSIAQAVAVAAALATLVDGGSMIEATPSLAAALVALALRAGLVWAYQTRSAAAAGRIAGRLRTELFGRIAAMGLGWSMTQRSGALQNTLVDGVEQIEAYFRLFVAQVIASLLTVIAVVIALSWIDPLVGLVVGALVTLAAIGPALSWRLLGTRLRHWWTVAPAMSAEHVDAMGGMATLKMFGAASTRRRALERRADDVLAASISLNNIEYAALQPFALAQIAAGIAAVWIGVAHVESGQLGAGELLLILMLVGEAIRPIAETKRALHFAMQGMGAAEAVLTILEAPVMAAGTVALTRPCEGPPGLSFDSVGFRYRADGPAVLDEFTLRVEPGETVALIGASGAGKSTVASLLLRFIDPQQGVVAIDGVPVERLAPGQLRSLVALVPQDTYLFSGTIGDNLRIAKPDATDDELDRAMESAAASELLVRLPDGYDTEVGERGLKLSGGERQRIAIARALLADTPILVLDEPTANVDVASEAIIQQALARLSSGRTVLLIAHRLSTVHNADRIIVLDRGRVVQSGTHAELAASPGRYRALLDADAASVDPT